MTVIGQGFPPESVVMIMWSSSTGSVVATTNSSGELRATLMILVPDVIGRAKPLLEVTKRRRRFS